MNLPELLACMDRLDIQLTARYGMLRVDAPPGAITPNLRAEFVHHKSALLDRLRGAARTGTGPALRPDNQSKANRRAVAARGDDLRAQGLALPLCSLPPPQERVVLPAPPGKREDGILWFE